MEQVTDQSQENEKIRGNQGKSGEIRGKIIFL